MAVELKDNEAIFAARRVEAKDGATLLRWYNNPAIQATLEDEQRSAAQLRRKVEDLVSCDPYEDCRCVILFERDSRPIGMAYFMWINWISRTAEVDLMLSPEQPHGPLTGYLMMLKIADMSFREFNLHKMYGFIYGDNRRSLRLFQRFMHVEAVLKAYAKRGQRYEDVHVLGALACDYDAYCEKQRR
jgi:RimJ/RimL family protein N-acetyltransferase